MATTHYPHIFLSGLDQPQGFTNPRRGRINLNLPPRDRAPHSDYLRNRLQAAWDEAGERDAVAHVERLGTYIDFSGDPGRDLVTKSLENIASRIRLLNVRAEGTEGAERTIATVYVPHEKRHQFLRKINAYATEIDGRSGKPKNFNLINSISDIRLSVLESFWRPDERTLIPGDEPCWLEVWLRSNEGGGTAKRFRDIAAGQGVGMIDGELSFPERTVLLVQANRLQLECLVEASDDIAEFRKAKEVSTFFSELDNQDQSEWVAEILDRTSFDADSEVSVCILDHGVNNGHLLLQPVLADSDLHTVIPQWGTHDHHGHGTLMAGTVAYGDLLEVLNSGGPVRVAHRLESAKIVPPPPAQNPQQVWGLRTAQGVSLAKIQAPNRKRIVCLAIAATDTRDRGRPSSWSSEIDKVTSGAEDGAKLLFIVSAGNVINPDHWRNYPNDNITNEVHDPGQSWNAITVGAYTDKVSITDPTLSSYTPIAPRGGLSPFSTTSVTWQRKWPIKPEVVFEGGNVAAGPNDSVCLPDDLSLLSTYYDPQVAQFAASNATSAAAAQASWMAARIQVQYPEAWPETIRALIVHSAEWTDALRSQFLPENPNKTNKANLLRICGYGVPNLEHALYCASNSLTMISQAELQPYGVNAAGSRVTKDMQLYTLPWPIAELDSMGETQVRMRVTLSYFVEPGPCEIGWQDRYRYPSHLLRFALNGPAESQDEFVHRINKQARDESGHPGTKGPADKWMLGEARDVGSIHSDIWEGTAVELAASNLIAVYPVIGWWKARHHLNRVTSQCRYALVVSIETPSEEIDIYTPVAVQIGVPIEIAT